MAHRYKPGENFMPKISRSRQSNDEAEDRRMVEEVREMSLSELGLRGSGSYERGTRHRVREPTGPPRHEDTRQRGRQARDLSGGSERTGPSNTANSTSQARQIEHQSSLRSLLSTSDLDQSEMEEEILRQIMEEGILDGIDLNNMDVSQEDELSQKIADAYRRRHRQRSGPQDNRVETSTTSTTSITHDQRLNTREQRQQRRPGRSPNSNPADQATHSSHPPISRPHLLEAYPTSEGHRRRTSSETRRNTSPNASLNDRRKSSETQRQAARSATDLSSRPQSSSNQRARPSNFSSTGRRTTDPDLLRPRGESRDHGSRTAQAPRSPRTRAREIPSTQANVAIISPPRSSPRSPGSEFSTVASRPTPTIAQEGPQQTSNSTGAHRVLSQSTIVAAAPSSLPSYSEPSISCDRCDKPNLEYELHENCATCSDGKYNLCLRCYRTSRGCLHWFGFGPAAMQRYQQQGPANGYPTNHSLPHRLKGHRYLPPPPETRNVAMSDSRLSTSSDPSQRLEAGPFCSNCSNFTPKCYWKCDVCNESEWGYCNACVNQGKCCTHALLPVSYTASSGWPISPLLNQSQHSTMTAVELFPRSTSAIDSSSSERYLPLTFSTKCDICTYPIPPSNTRFHCPQCHDGDYDIDTTCYHRLVHTGKISVENGPRGWRRCPNGHRMIIVGFEDSNVGQRRIVVEDLVGGHALKDEAEGDSSLEWSWREEGQRQAKIVSKAASARTATSIGPSATDGTPPLLKRYPPNGGVGMHVLARWAWWPQDGANDELGFPKGAEIRECEDINGDWFWGIYCGRKGLFPSNYGRIVETVQM